MTSPAQQNANARNATKSTGPKTVDGKERSARNATVHGVYRATPGPVTAGPFAEDPDRVDDQVAAIIRGLRPRDDLERIHARHVAEAYLDLQRVSVYKTVSLAAPAQRRRSRSRTDDDDHTPTPGDADQIMAKLNNALRVSGTVYRQLRMAKAEYDNLQERRLERDVGYAGDIEVQTGIDDLVDAQGQVAAWAARARFIEGAQARQKHEAEEAEVKRQLRV